MERDEPRAGNGDCPSALIWLLRPARAAVLVTATGLAVLEAMDPRDRVAVNTLAGELLVADDLDPTVRGERAMVRT